MKRFSEYIVRYWNDDSIDFQEEIVRCRDCKYCELLTVCYLDRPLYVCNAWWCEGAEGDNPLVKPDGFCAWGERKERIEQ